MELNSCLYETDIMHCRLSPKLHRFSYKFFSFYLDLDELDSVVSQLKLVSRNRWNLYGFYDLDHLSTGQETIKENILSYLSENGIHLNGGKIRLLTYLRMMGYVFNPVSFYYCFDENDKPVCVVAEIGNTFGEQKMFIVKAGEESNQLKDSQTKYYYISPFTDLDDTLDFRLGIPDEHLNIAIDTSKDKQKIVVTTMKGRRRTLNDLELLKLTLKFPFITLKVISLIHWHAFLLWLKKIPFHEKQDNLHLQKEVHRAWNRKQSTAQDSKQKKDIQSFSKHH